MKPDPIFDPAPRPAGSPTQLSPRTVSARAISVRRNGLALLQDVTLDAAAGECVVLTGSEDGGRRALIRVLATLEPPSSGSLLIAGMDAGVQAAVRSRVSFAAGESLGGERLTVGEYLRLLTPVPPDAGIVRLLRAAQVSDDVRIDELAASARAIVAIAGACAVRADVLLLDLASDAIEAGVRPALAACVADAVRRGAAVVISTGDESAFAAVCGRGMRLEGGRTVAEWRSDSAPAPAAGVELRVSGNESPEKAAGAFDTARSLRLVTRELIVTARTGAFWAAAVAHLLALAAFVLVWGDGLPVQGSGTAFEQFAAFESLLLAVMLPWVAVRCGVPDRRDRLPLLAMTTGASLREALLAKCAGQTMTLLAVVVLALPLWMVMRQVSVASIGDLGTGVLVLATLAPAAAVLGILGAVVSRSRMIGWVVAAALLVVVA